MRVFAFTFLIAIFLTNMVIVSAWAKPCLESNVVNTSKHSASQLTDHTNKMDEPCEEMAQKQKPDSKPHSNTPHCDGVCLCLHTSSQQTYTLNPAQYLPIPSLISAKHVFPDERYSDIPFQKLKRPPRA